nr:AntigenB like protein [Hymenolepis microstoma]
MRSLLFFLALTLVVATVSAEVSITKRLVDSGKEFYSATDRFFAEDPLGQKIVKFFKDIREMAAEGRSRVRERIAKYIRELKAEAQ